MKAKVNKLKMQKSYQDIHASTFQLSGKNSNIFVGDTEYKLSFFLKFLVKSTSERFYIHMLSRLRRLDRIIRILFTIFILCCFIFLMNFYILIILIINAITCKLSSRNLKFALTIIQEALTIILVNRMHLSNTSLLICVIVGFHSLSNFALVIPWFINSVSTYFVFTIYFIMENIYNFENISNQILLTKFENSKLNLEHLILIFFLISIPILYGYLERLMKENWVLFDSFKRSEKIHIDLCCQGKKFIICNEQGFIEYGNINAFNLISNIPIQIKKTKFSNYLHPNYINTFTETIKKVNKSIHYSPDASGFYNSNSFHQSILTPTSRQPQYFEFSALILRETNLGFCQDDNLNINDILNTTSSNLCSLKIQKCNWKNKKGNILIVIKDITRKYLQNKLLILNTELSRRKQLDLIFDIKKIMKNHVKANKFISKIINSDFFLTELVCNKYNEIQESFTFKDFIIFIVDHCSYKAFKRKIQLSIQFDPNFPLEVKTDMKIFQFVIKELLCYVIRNSNQGKVYISYQMKDASSDYYIANIKIKSTSLNERGSSYLSQAALHSNENFQNFYEINDISKLKVCTALMAARKFLKSGISFNLNEKDSGSVLVIESSFLRNVDMQKIRKVLNPNLLISNEMKEYSWREDNFEIISLNQLQNHNHAELKLKSKIWKNKCRNFGISYSQREITQNAEPSNRLYI